MVFRGRPSRGCEFCRKACVKCDEKTPSCCRCYRLRKTCTGYRKLDGLMLLDETEKTKSNYWRRSEQRDAKINVGLLLDSAGKDDFVWLF